MLGHIHLNRWIRRFVGDTKAAAAVEFAICLPFLIVLLAGITEIGTALWDQAALTKSVRASARYLARVSDPSSSTAQTAATNIALRGQYDSSANSTLPYIVSYWKNDATLTFNISTFNNLDGSGNKIFNGGDTLQIIKVTASVTAPSSAFPLLSLIKGLSSISYSATHEERYIGD